MFRIYKTTQAHLYFDEELDEYVSKKTTRWMFLGITLWMKITYDIAPNS